MKYVHISSGTVVDVKDGKVLDEYMFRPVSDDKPKRAGRKKAPRISDVEEPAADENRDGEQETANVDSIQSADW